MPALKNKLDIFVTANIIIQDFFFDRNTIKIVYGADCSIHFLGIYRTAGKQI